MFSVFSPSFHLHYVAFILAGVTCCSCSHFVDIESCRQKQVVYIYIYLTPGNKHDILQMIAGKNTEDVVARMLTGSLYL